MKKPSDKYPDWEDRREKIIGLGESSSRKSYYPELQKRIRELNEKQDVLERAQELGQIGSWTYYFATDRFVVTKEVCRIYGLPEKEEHSYRAFMRVVHPSSRKVVAERFRNTLHGELHDIEYRLLVDGETRWIREKGNIEFDEEGKPLRAIGFTQDITEIKEKEASLREKNAELDVSNKELERFTYTVSHDLKSPLITIKGFAGMLEERLREHRDKTLLDDLGHISAAAGKMYSLLNDLLKLSQVGQAVDMSKLVDLNTVVQESIELLSGVLAENPAEIKALSPLPKIRGDQARLRVVFQNLLENSIKYMGDQAAPTVEVGTDVRDGRPACFVRDNGIGIAAEYQSKVFGLFERLHSDNRGTGVGLALVESIVKKHHGDVWIESDGKGHGTTVWMVFPNEELSDDSR